MTDMDEKTREWFREKGREGGLKTLRKYGTEHYRRISPSNNITSKKLSTDRAQKGVDSKDE